MLPTLNQFERLLTLLLFGFRIIGVILFGLPSASSSCSSSRTCSRPGSG